MSGINVTLESTQLVEEILNGFRKEIAELKESYRPREAKRYLTSEQAEEYLGVDRSTLYNWRKQGKIKAKGLGGRIYFALEDLEAAMIPLNH